MLSDEDLDNFSNTSSLDLNDMVMVNYDKKYLYQYILLGIFGIFICIIGIFGNILSIVVLNKQSMKKLSTYAYLVALSACDAIGLAFTIVVFLQYSIPLGSTTPSWMSEYLKLLDYIYPIVATSQTLSVWITLAFTIDRYLYVCKPFLGEKLCTRKRSCVIICCLYIMSIIYSIPQFFERRYEIVKIEPNKPLIFSSLTEFGRSQTYFRIYHLFLYTILICVIPFVTIAVLNSFLILNIVKSNKRHRDLDLSFSKYKSNSLQFSPAIPLVVHEKAVEINQDEDNNENKQQILEQQPQEQQQQEKTNNNLSNTSNKNHSKSSIFKNSIFFNYKRRSEKNSDVSYTENKYYRNDVTVLLIGLVIVFMICQLPSVILRLVTFKDRSIMFESSVYNTLMDISNFLIVLNSTINCVLYIMLGKKFRKEFLRTICPNVFLKKTSTQIYLRRLSYRNTLVTNTNNNNNKKLSNGKSPSFYIAVNQL